jgi:hypothetical protein
VGLRRALVRHLAYGALDPGDLQSRHRRAFEIWEQRGRQQLRLTRREVPEFGPFYGCRWCEARCEFRHLGEASEEFGAPAIHTTMSPVWTPVPTMNTFDKIRYWSVKAAIQLEPLVGDEAARHTLRCAQTQFASKAGMPRDEVDRLLVAD